MGHSTTILKIPFKAEAACASIMEQGISLEYIATNLLGAFKKTYANDIAGIAIDGKDHQPTFTITINRDGIYDKLPEGLFHQTKGMLQVRSVQDAVDEHKKYKEEEKQARAFFAPIESIIFQYKIAAEQAERDALFQTPDNNWSTAIKKFWHIDASLPNDAAARLTQLMPYAATIKGSIIYTREALAFLLQKEVDIVDAIYTDDDMTFDDNNLKDLRLGINSVIGSAVNEWSSRWVITIQHIAFDELITYISDGINARIIDRFIEIFIPIDKDILLNYDIQETTEHSTTVAILGYNSTI